MGWVKKFCTASALCTMLSLLNTNSALAVDNTPTSTQPGIVIKNLEEDRRAPASLEGNFIVEDKQSGADDASKEKVFTLEKVILEGSTIYSESEVNNLLAGYIGKPVSLNDLNVIAKVLTKEYRNDGYVFSSVILPPQKIKDGIVRLKAVEGRITEVTLTGDYKDGNCLIKDMADKIRSDGPSSTKDLERYLLLIDDLPGVKARSILRPSSTPGGGELIINIEQDSFEGALGIDNRGSQFIGRYRGTAVAAFNSALGIHDRTTLRAILTNETEELRFADITHEEQIGSDGLNIRGRFAMTETEPGEELSLSDIRGTSRLFDIEAIYPIIRGRQLNLNIQGGFTVLNTHSDVLSLQTSEDKVRYVYAGTRFDFTDSLAGINQFDLSFAQGIDGLGATGEGLGRSRVNSEQDFFRANFYAARIQDIYAGFSVELAASGQYSADELLASEEFSIGGEEFGRGYDAGEIAGDKGIDGSIELRYSDNTGYDFLQTYQLYTFYDAGKVWNKNPGVGETSHESLASAGIGARFNLDYDISGYLEFSTPLTRNVAAEHDDGSRIFFSFLKRI